MIQFRLIHLLEATAYASLIAALIPFGELDRSVIPVLLHPAWFLIPVAWRFEECPSVLRTRYHLATAILVSLIIYPGLLYEYGWWRIPFSLVITFFMVPAVLGILQLIKRQSRDQPNIELRIAQIVAIWLPVTMLGTARLFGRIMPFV